MTEMTSDANSAELHGDLTPTDALKDLAAGNRRYATGELTVRNHTQQFLEMQGGKVPKAIILSCVDPRVPVELIFDSRIGDLFVARVAGNQVDVDILGSMEYACSVAGSKAVVVLGHQHCGAVKSAVDGVTFGNITGLLAKILPAVEAVDGYEDDRTSANDELVAAVTEENVRNAVAAIRERSPILAEMEANGQIAIVGAVYDLETGAVAFLD